MSLLPEVRDMTAFDIWERVSQVPEKCWLLSNLQKCSYGPGWTGPILNFGLSGLALLCAKCSTLGPDTYVVIFLFLLHITSRNNKVTFNYNDYFSIYLVVVMIITMEIFKGTIKGAYFYNNLLRAAMVKCYSLCVTSFCIYLAFASVWWLLTPPFFW